MIIKTELFQDACKKILDAVDTNVNTLVSETLELEAKGNKLYLNVTNKEYYVTVAIDLDESEEFTAVISANLFLTLISKVTTPTIELLTKDNALVVKANGNYKFPLIFDGETYVKLPKIEIEEVTNSFTVPKGVLQSILKYNSKELLKSGIRKEVQKMFYVDELGAITFANGACINSFNLTNPVKLLLNEKTIKLFKLFTDADVLLSIGFTNIGGGIVQSRVQFKDSKVELTTIITSDDNMLNSVPVRAIRGMGDTSYQNNVVFEKNLLLSAINRLTLFTSKDEVNPAITFSFTKDSVVVFDTRKENHECVGYVPGTILTDDEYTCKINASDLKLTLELSEETHLTMRFGNHRAVVFERNSIKNILPEIQ